MNIIKTLPCGCHRGMKSTYCEVALSLEAAMKASYDKTELLSLFDVKHREAWGSYEQCRRAYLAHFEQVERVVVPV